MNMMMMRGLNPADFARGQTTRAMLWPNGGVVHATNYVAEQISLADLTKPDTACLNGRGLITLSKGDRALVPEYEVGIHRAMVDYYNLIGVSNMNPRDIIGIPSDDSLKPVCAHAVNLINGQIDQVGSSQLATMIMGARYMVPIIGSENSIQLAEHLGLTSETTAEAVNRANNKGELEQAAKDFGFLTPPKIRPRTMAELEEAFNELMQQAKAEPLKYDEKNYIKLLRSSGGEGVRAFTDVNELVHWTKYQPLGRSFQMTMTHPGPHEGVLLEIGARGDDVPNIGIFVGKTPAEDAYLGDSAQVIADGSIHVGNKGMLSASDTQKIAPIMKKVCNWLRSIGFSGVAGIDVVMGANGDIWVIDINARWNACTSTLLKFNDFRHMPGVGVFRYTGKVEVPNRVDVHDFFAHLERQGLTFNGDRGGVIPINFMTAHRPDGKDGTYISAQIFAPDDRTAEQYFDRAHYRPAA